MGMEETGRPAVVVSADDALDDVVRRLRSAGAGARPVELAVPADSSLLLTAAEFRGLKDTLDRERLAVLLVTPDPLRIQLAKLLGVPAEQREVTIPPVAPPSVEGPARVVREPSKKPKTPEFVRPVAADPPERVVAPPPPEPSRAAGDRPAVVPPALAVTDEGAGANPDTLWPDGPPPPPERRGVLRRRTKASAPPRPVAEPEGSAETVGAGEPSTDLETDGGDREAVEVLPATERRRKQHRGWAVAAAVILGLIGLGVLLLPGATVAVTMKRQPLAADLVYDVTASGQPLDAGADLAVPAVPAKADVTWEGTIPTTGERLVPDGVAGGPISFSNPTDSPQEVAAGTRMTTELGIAFTLAEAVTVPARDAATGRPGRADGNVVAVDPGGAGNVGTGEIGGKLPSGVYFSNREQGTEGGTDKSVATVAAADLDALRAQAQAAFPDAAGQAFGSSLPSGQSVLPSSVQPGQPTESFSATEGQDADTLTLKVVWQASALAVDQDAISRDLAQAEGAKLDALVPTGYALEEGSITPGAAEVVTQGPEGVRYRLPVTAEAMAQLPQPQRRALAERLAGSDPATVDAVMGEFPDITAWDVSYWPPFLPDRIPKNVGRIKVEVRP